MHRRLAEAVGDDASPAAVQTLELATTGALLQVGTGHLAYDAVPGLLADDPDVRVLRERIGAELHRRLLVALGPDADPAQVATLQFAVSGALLQVGTGHLSYAELPGVLDSIAHTILGSTR
jgi:hypothetical protein